MGIPSSIDWKALTTPFAPDLLEYRVGRAGLTAKGDIYCMALTYLTARAVMDRFDEVVGPPNWFADYTPVALPKAGDGLFCSISVQVSPGVWVTKGDVGVASDMEAVKGAYSDSLKRAAVHWGIGRYLYGLSETFATILPDNARGPNVESGSFEDKETKKRRYFKWSPPALPDWALPPKGAK